METPKLGAPGLFTSRLYNDREQRMKCNLAHNCHNRRAALCFNKNYLLDGAGLPITQKERAFPVQALSFASTITCLTPP